MIRKRKKKSKTERLLFLHTKQLTQSAKILEQLFKIYKSGLDKGFDVVGVSYLLDLLVVHLIPYYGGDKKIVEDLKKNIQNEMIAFNSSPPIKDTIEELKKAGIDFSVVYDVRKKEAVPSIDIKKIKLSDEDMKKWVKINLEKILNLVEELKETKSEEQS